MKARAFFRSSKLMLPGVVIGAQFHPGFVPDLTCWRLAIDEHGNLFQDTEIRRWLNGTGMTEERRQEQGHIGSEALLGLLCKAEEIGFQAFQPTYRETTDDVPSYCISIRFGKATTETATEENTPAITTVQANYAALLARRGDGEMQGFMELWEMIHRHAPYQREP